MPYIDKYWNDLEIIPRTDDYVNIESIASEEDFGKIYETSRCWSGEDGIVNTVTLKKDEKGFYYEIWILCEDK